MKAKHKRLWLVVLSLFSLALGTGAILRAFGDNLVFFYTPTQLTEKRQQAGFNFNQTMRIGGLVKAHSVTNLPGGGIRFVITDLNSQLPVIYKGFVPSLFREGQGVVAQGRLDKNSILVAEQILAKHDENYMPREVMDALKSSGRWREEGGYKTEDSDAMKNALPEAVTSPRVSRYGAAKSSEEESLRGKTK